MKCSDAVWERAVIISRHHLTFGAQPRVMSIESANSYLFVERNLSKSIRRRYYATSSAAQPERPQPSEHVLSSRNLDSCLSLFRWSALLSAMAVARPLRFLALGTVLIFLYILTHMFGGSVSLRTPSDASTQFRVAKGFRDPNLDGALAHIPRRWPR